MPVGNRLVKASRLYLRLTTDLSPFMFEVPRAFGPYDKLFKELGTKQSPSIRVSEPAGRQAVTPSTPLVDGRATDELVLSPFSLTCPPPQHPQDFAQLLSELKQEVGSSPLNPNELEAVIKVVSLLADTLASQRSVSRRASQPGGRWHNSMLTDWLVS